MSEDFAQAYSRIYELYQRGRRLSADALQDLEFALCNNPDDLDLRATLLGGYSANLKANLRDFTRHQTWIIENAPSDVLADLAITCTAGFPELFPEDYHQIFDAWCKCSKSNLSELEALVHACMFFRMHHEFEMATIAVRQAMTLAPNDCALIEMLVEIIDSSNQVTPQSSKELFLLTEGILESEANPVRLLNLSARLAEFALKTENWSKAFGFVKNILDQSNVYDNTGYAIHTAHIVAGRLALREQDEASASIHLLKSLEIPGDPTFFMNGPDLELAAELLATGELEVVEKYLGTCMQFPFGEAQLNQIRTWCLEKGVLPPFS